MKFRLLKPYPSHHLEVGNRVKLSKLGLSYLDRHPYNKDTRGTVTSLRPVGCLKITRDGCVHPRTHPIQLWVKARGE